MIERPNLIGLNKKGNRLTHVTEKYRQCYRTALVQGKFLTAFGSAFLCVGFILASHMVALEASLWNQNLNAML
jgi:hypothetical protein